MSRDSLAQQAAAWVPPWERPPAAPRQHAAGDRPAEGEAAPAAQTPVQETARVEAAPPTGPAVPADEADPAHMAVPTGPAVPPLVEEVRAADAEQLEPGAAALADAASSWTGAEPSAEDVPAVGPDPGAPATAPQPAPDAALPEAGLPEAGLPDAGLPDAGLPAAAFPEARAVATAAGPDRLDDPVELRAALEAILLVVDEPAVEETLAQVLDRPVDQVTAALHELAAEYATARRGFDLRRAAGGWRLYTRVEYAPYVERFVLDGQQLRLTQAALETLAVVAYKQPVSRSRISAIRGVNCDGVVRTLVTRGLIEDCGTEPETGARLYATTQLFLEKLGMDSVTELPPLAPFLPDDVDEVADAQP